MMFQEIKENNSIVLSFRFFFSPYFLFLSPEYIHLINKQKKVHIPSSPFFSEVWYLFIQQLCNVHKDYNLRRYGNCFSFFLNIYFYC